MKRSRSIWLRLATMPNGDFSISRLLMVFSAIQACGVMWTGIISYLVNGVDLPVSVYTFAAGIFGGGATQYGYTKHVVDKKDGRAGVPQDKTAVDQPGAV